MKVTNIRPVPGPRRAYDLTIPGTHCYFVGPGVLAHNCSLRYDGGKLVQAVTRGDGTIGEDITRNVELMQGAVKVVPGALSGYVRGEIICRKSDFQAHFAGAGLANPRNTASGVSKRQSSPEACRNLTVIAYRVLPDSGPLATKLAEFQWLQKTAGFLTPFYASVKDTAEVQTTYQAYVATRRAALDYDIDGLVIEIDLTSAAEALGELNNRPKGAIAFKFPHDAKPTKLNAGRWQVGNSGRITPVAEFDPVDLAGASVKQANLHNISNITALVEDARPGQTLLLKGDAIIAERRNDVIPNVQRVLGGGDPTQPFTIPTECPACKATLERDGEYLVCRNLDCSAQAAGSVKRWVKKLGVLYVGDGLIEALMDAGLVADPADLYTLDAQKAASVYMGGRLAGGSATKAMTALNAKKTLPLHVFVGALGIPQIGRTMAKIIVDGGFNTLSKMLKATYAEIAALPGVGDSKAKSFVDGFMSKLGLISKLLQDADILIQDATGPMVGQSFCMTGFRDQTLADALEKAGATMKSGVSKGLTYLIALDPASQSGKAQKARTYGTKVIGVDEARKLAGV